MDIKLKNIRYSRGAKLVAVLIVWFCTMSTFGSGLFLLYNHEVIDGKTYYETSQFKDEFSRLVDNVVEFNVKLKSEKDILASGNADYIIKSDLDRYQRIEHRLSNLDNFAYHLKNTKTGDTVSNLGVGDGLALIQKQPTVVHYNQWTTNSTYSLSSHINKMLLGTPYEIYAAVLEPLKPGDVFYDGFKNYSRIKALSAYATVFLVTSIILGILTFIYLVIVAGREEKGEVITLLPIDKIYVDVHTLLVFFAALISVASVQGVDLHNRVGLIMMVVVFGLDILIGLSYVLSLIRQIKNRQIFKNSLIYRIMSLCFSKAFKVSLLLLLLAYGVINGILFFLTFSGNGSLGLIYILLLWTFNIVAIYLAAKSLLSLALITKAVKETSTGNLDYTLDNSQISVTFLDLAKDINSIQGGLKGAVAEAVKGERMRTDLITNVSHDLKTPLTSIINYVDLLKKEDLNNQKADEYLEVLDEKSSRLKQLINDLIEASKASSGNLTVTAEKVDLHELVMQACGEYEEKINQAELDMQVNTANKQIIILADGKHMWRIVENLLSNVVKYSMLHSRVYIDIDNNDQYGLLIIKNISANPLNISPEQLTERFVRGDVSRTTEGSGLGLSIAQSLTIIQGGKFRIEIDGDLFKVTVEVPLR